MNMTTTNNEYVNEQSVIMKRTATEIEAIKNDIYYIYYDEIKSGRYKDDAWYTHIFFDTLIFFMQHDPLKYFELKTHID